MNQAPITILYEDQDVLAVEKPPGLLTVPGRGPDNQDCLIHRLLTNHPNSRIVHRLDMATSGIVLIPQNHDSLSELSRQFQQRTIKKRYQAIVDGIVEKDSGVIDLPLMCDWPNRPKQKVCHEQGKPSRTEFHVLQRNRCEQPESRVELTPITGRSHQLRVHMMALGHAIVGDYFYAEPGILNRSDRLLLHATCLQFSHPRSGELITVESAAPF